MEKGTLPKCFLKSIIILLPKPGKPPGPVGNLRPISLLEIHRKIITRAVNWRIKKVLEDQDKIIERNQR